MAEGYKEEVLNISGSSSSFAILTLSERDDAPVIVQFNAGVLHRSEPYRLNTELARKAAQLGFHSVRFDVAGNGDAEVRDGLDENESVMRDWYAVRQSIEQRLGQRKYLFMGLCSGADNSIKVASQVQETVGLILLDPTPPVGSIDNRSVFKNKLRNPWFWLRLPLNVCKSLFKTKVEESSDGTIADYHYEGLPLQYGNRALPSEAELSEVMHKVSSAGGILSVFTSYSSQVISSERQLADFFDLSDKQREHFVEAYFPDMEHLFALAEHRKMLLRLVSEWLSALKL